MGRGKLWQMLPVLMGIVLFPTLARGQIVFGEETRGRLRVIATNWTIDDGQESSLQQFLVPFFGYVPLGENIEGRIYLARTTNTLDSAGQSDTLDGLTDTRVQVNRSFLGDRFLLSLGASLPTGKTGLDMEGNLRVMGVLASDYLIYPNRRLGEGLGLSALVGGALVLGEYRLGGSLSYHYAGKYEAFSGQGDYQPGSSIRAYAGVQRPLGRFQLSTGITVSGYGDDTIDGRRVYNRGRQIDAHLGGNYSRPDFHASLVGRAFLRGSNEVFDLSGAELSQVDLFGDEVFISAACSWFFRGQTLEVGPVLDSRFISTNGVGLGHARSFGAGAQTFVRVSPVMRLGLSFQYFTGEADGGALDISGYQVASSLSGAF